MVYCYCRVSSDIQGKDGVSLEQQEETLVKWAKGLGEEYEVYKEIKTGRSVEKRPIFTGVLSSMTEGDTLMVYDQTRLGRNTKNDIEVAEQIIAKGFKLFVDGRYIDLNNPNDYFLFTMNSGFATLQTRMQSKKSTEAIKRVREEGNWIFDGRLFGYIVTKRMNKTSIEIDEQAAHYIRYIFEEVAKGRPVGSLTSELYGTICPNFPEWKFADTPVREMLRRPIYMGYYFKIPKLKNKVKEMTRAEIESSVVKSNKYPPIVDEETWWNAWKNWHSVHMDTLYRNSNKEELSGIFKCGYCGARSDKNYRKKKKDGTRQAEFRITRHFNYCKTPIFKGYEMEQYTWIMRELYFLTFLGGDEVGGFVEEKKSVAEVDVDTLGKEVEMLLNEIKESDKKIGNLMKSVEEGNSYSNIKGRVEELEDKKRKLSNQIEGIRLTLNDKREYIDELVEMSAENKIEEMIAGTNRRKLYIDLCDARQFVGYAEIRYLNGKKFIVEDNKLNSRRPTPQRFKVFFKDELQYEGTLDFGNKTMTFDREEETDDFKKSYNNYLGELEDKVKKYMEECQ